jgi:hypothetical protein
MVEQDIFVGVVALLTGLFVFGSAALNSQWVSRFWIARHIENASNAGVSKLVIMAIGALCMILGTLLILGFFPSEKSRKADQEFPSLTHWLATTE